VRKLFELLLAAVLAVAIIAALALKQYVVLVVAIAALFLLFVRSSKQDEKNDNKQRLEHYKLLEEQSNWSGSRLRLKPRWFIRAGCSGIFFSVAYLFLSDISRTISSNLSEPVFLVSFFLSGFIFLYFFWLNFASLVREVICGYSLKLDEQGLTIAGYSAIPWSNVYRAGYKYVDAHDTESLDQIYLQLDVSPDALGNDWASSWRLLLLGPAGLAFSKFKGSGQFALSGIFLSLPVPTVATAVCVIGSQHAYHPVVKWNPYESLEDARRLHILKFEANMAVEVPAMRHAFDVAAQAFAKPGNKIDSRELKAAIKDWELKSKAKLDAQSEYLEESTKVADKNHKKQMNEINMNAKVLGWVLGVGLTLTLVAYLAHWFVY
jgi:hypothetical protein